MKLEHFDSLYLQGNAYGATRDNSSMVKVDVYSEFGKVHHGHVFIPMTTYKLGYSKFQDAVKARIKHDLKMTYDHYSSSGM